MTARLDWELPSISSAGEPADAALAASALTLPDVGGDVATGSSGNEWRFPRCY